MSDAGFAFSTDGFGRLVCDIHIPGQTTRVTAWDVRDARAHFLAALDDAREAGLGECFWHSESGDYRWMFRRSGARVTVVALWSTGAVTGWEHVAFVETDADRFDADARAMLDALE